MHVVDKVSRHITYYRCLALIHFRSIRYTTPMFLDEYVNVYLLVWNFEFVNSKIILNIDTLCVIQNNAYAIRN